MIDATPATTDSCRACVVATFPVPAPFEGASRITTGADGRAWFVDTTGGRVGAVTSTGSFSSFELPGSNLKGITRGPDGKLWAIDGPTKLARIAPDGTISHLDGGTDQLTGITTGPDGNVWIAGVKNLHRVTPNGVVSTFPLDHPEAPATAIAAGPDGNLWVTRQGGVYSNVTHVTRVSTSGQVTTFATSLSERPTVSVRAGIAAGPSGALWFSTVPGLARVTTSGVVSEVELPAGGLPSALVALADGSAAYFADADHRVGTIAANGTITQIPILYAPDAMTLGNDGTIWMTAHEGLSSFIVVYRP